MLDITGAHRRVSAVAMSSELYVVVDCAGAVEDTIDDAAALGVVEAVRLGRVRDDVFG